MQMFALQSVLPVPCCILQCSCPVLHPSSLRYLGCCVGNHQTVLQQDTSHQYYRAVEGEIFMMPCIKTVSWRTEVSWSKIEDGRGGNEVPPVVCGSEFITEAKHSGKYTHSGSESFLHLQVVERISLGCFEPEESRMMLTVSEGGVISCPGLNCSDNTGVIWYKGNEAVSEQHRTSCQRNGRLHLCEVYKQDTGVYFCDRKMNDGEVNWTFRRAVNVTVVPSPECDPPSIHSHNKTEAVELGQSHTLVCEVQFPFEIVFSGKVQWYRNYGGNMENMTRLHMEEQQQERVTFTAYEVIGRAIIEEVTLQHLNHTYTCIASNTFGNSSITIKLEEKIKEKWPSLVGYPIASLLLVVGLGIVLHVKWLEIQLIYRSYFLHGKDVGGEKEFDVFLSCVWSPSSAQVEGVLTFSSQKGPDTDDEACLSCVDLLDTEEGKVAQGPLEVLLPKVLEGRWGYRLCLPERDILPGGAYTNDVVLAIQRSQILICVLSADYLSNSNAVFELESAVQALLQSSTLKLLLIWTCRASASLIRPDPPLPTLVQRALKVLPSLDWTSGKPSRATSDFWRSLRRSMPNQNVRQVSLMQDK
ncbi:interleukin-18 receptor accessory protein-like [Plectropomus leopardus]|uniref:interleukin-18 receptor accessory protein-like n=1 Tax=Plectropomus leopardus TaxID=160734 RepID=UPI001C4BF119|nr:interleukin-18 receptor accessory protein-like [Plectropomus leopardus]